MPATMFRNSPKRCRTARSFCVMTPPERCPCCSESYAPGRRPLHRTLGPRGGERLFLAHAAAALRLVGSGGSGRDAGCVRRAGAGRRPVVGGGFQRRRHSVRSAHLSRGLYCALSQRHRPPQAHGQARGPVRFHRSGFLHHVGSRIWLAVVVVRARGLGIPAVLAVPAVEIAVPDSAHRGRRRRCAGVDTQQGRRDRSPFKTSQAASCPFLQPRRAAVSAMHASPAPSR